MREAEYMQQNLRGEEGVIPTLAPPPTYTDQDCKYFGHTWQSIGLSGEKQCSVCHIKGYCPGCTQNPPVSAQPYYCSQHTPLTESTVSV